MLLVPTTGCLIGSRERESNLLYSEIVAQEDFLGSHVLRIPINTGSANGKEDGNVRDNRGKAKQVTTFNGRTVIIKENSVYSNKGWKLAMSLMIACADLGKHQVSSPSSRLSSCRMRFTTLRQASPDHGSSIISRDR